MDFGLAGCTALVAAGSRGLGRASARALAREGASVALFSRTAAAAEKAAHEIAAETHARTLGFAADTTKAPDLERAVAETIRAFGRLDVLVTNAGGPSPGTFATVTDADWQRAFELNLMSAVRLIRAALPHLEKSGRGRVILLSSTTVKQPIDGLILSNAVRIGVAGLAKTLANELGGKKITVNQVLPGRIDTDRVRELDEARAKSTGASADAVRRQNEQQIPVGRYGDPDEFGAVVAFLASAQAAYLTGATIQVDGGATKAVY
jgi:3-oxoacyl-[acyl-carrier protein] reductase